MQLLSLKQAAARLGCSYSYLYRLHRTGVLPVVKVGRFVRVSEDDLTLWINARKIAANIISATETARAERDKRRKALGIFTPSDFRQGEPEAS